MFRIALRYHHHEPFVKYNPHETFAKYNPMGTDRTERVFRDQKESNARRRDEVLSR
ncbi:hypothetical protein DPMN_071818 [Dreissena polymorpha]|uniref:Uncharacterized protein n=1 Tax=Dreissena polymorpha TaxID=45954 RepID=A0A9D3Z8G0_DREPO|nr:hypothetical protein DPMN_071818 [Dreissena polymorpha]